MTHFWWGLAAYGLIMSAFGVLIFDPVVAVIGLGVMAGSLAVLDRP